MPEPTYGNPALPMVMNHQMNTAAPATNATIHADFIQRKIA